MSHRKQNVTEIYYLADEFCRKDVVKHGDRSNSLSDTFYSLIYFVVCELMLNRRSGVQYLD